MYERYGSLQGENYFENRAKFESGHKPVATFPRSLSNLERRTVANVTGRTTIGLISNIMIVNSDGHFLLVVKNETVKNINKFDYYFK